jgi:Na+-transporting NADH:ubiquinone oxidoreductase subunit C
VNTTGYVLRFTLIMTTLVAVVLAGMFYATEPIAKTAEAVFNKRAILSAVDTHLPKKQEEMADQEVLQVFETKFEQRVIDMEGNLVDGVKAESVDMAQEEKKPMDDRLLPFYVYTDEAGTKYFILSVRGSGLWDKIWGNIALESDLTTIAGASFDHKGETPGLGAEIKDNPAFAAQFIGKKIYDEDGDYTSVEVVKGEAKNQRNEVDGISGATITCNGVSDMLYKGIKNYEPYLDKIETNKQTGMK